MGVEEQVWDRAVETLRAHDEIALACHVGPDGDALGSMLALGLALRSVGKRPAASFAGEPFAVPAMYSYLPGLDLLVHPADLPAAPSLLVTFDTGSVERLGALADRVGAASTVLVLDHHASCTRYGDLNLVDPDAAATAVLVAGLVDRLGAELTADVAACLYTGLSTDTGSFRFSATTPDVHHLAARLLATGIRHDEIARAIWDTNRFAYLKLLGRLIDRAQVVQPDSVVWTWVSRDDLVGADVVLDEIEGVIDVIRTAEEAEVAVVCKQALDGRWLVSMRSKGAVDVGRVAVALGGGGHRFAAGFTADRPPEQLMPTLLGALREAAAA